MPSYDQGSLKIFEFSLRIQQCFPTTFLREIFSKESQHNSKLLGGTFAGNQNGLHGQTGSWVCRSLPGMGTTGVDLVFGSEVLALLWSWLGALVFGRLPGPGGSFHIALSCGPNCGCHGTHPPSSNFKLPSTFKCWLILSWGLYKWVLPPGYS